MYLFLCHNVALWNEMLFLDNATLTNQYRLGLNQSIMVNDYTYSISNLTYIVSVENKSCAPVVEYNFGDLNGGKSDFKILWESNDIDID
jgi:hypothetical protein